MHSDAFRLSQTALRACIARTRGLWPLSLVFRLGQVSRSSRHTCQARVSGRWPSRARRRLPVPGRSVEVSVAVWGLRGPRPVCQGAFGTEAAALQPGKRADSPGQSEMSPRFPTTTQRLRELMSFLGVGKGTGGGGRGKIICPNPGEPCLRSDIWFPSGPERQRRESADGEMEGLLFSSFSRLRGPPIPRPAPPSGSRGPSPGPPPWDGKPLPCHTGGFPSLQLGNSQTPAGARAAEEGVPGGGFRRGADACSGHGQTLPSV